MTGNKTCERCGRPMQVRTARRRANAGNQFWGCSGYPRCKHTVDIQDSYPYVEPPTVSALPVHQRLNSDFKIVRLKQGSQAWHDWRRNGIGASDAQTAMSRVVESDKLLRVKAGLEVESDFQSDAMKRGSELEPEALRRYIERSKVAVSPVCINCPEVGGGRTQSHQNLG